MTAEHSDLILTIYLSALSYKCFVWGLRSIFEKGGSMKKLFIFLVLLLPVVVFAKEKSHIKTSIDQECYECHGNVMQIWQDGRHGLMNVKCVVCHGSTEKNFVARPGIERCSGCHNEKVSDVEKKLPPSAKRCTLCHDPHSVGVRFHGERR